MRQSLEREMTDQSSIATVRDILRQKRNFLLIAWPLGAVMFFLAKGSPWIAEYIFARGIFKVYGEVMSRISGIIPFSLAEWLVIGVPFGILAVIVYGVFGIILKKGRRGLAALMLIRRLLIPGGIIFLWFMIGAGTNYYRYEFASFSGLNVEDSTTEELYGLCINLAERARLARTEATMDETVPFVSAMSDRARVKAAVSAMEKLSGDFDVLKGYYPPAKSVFFSKAMSEFNITGVYFPWTVEANVNTDVPDYSIGVTICHELSHLRGFMREDEANFIGYLACAGSDNAELRYSGYMLALIYAGNRLYGDSRELYFELYSTYSDGMRTDLADNNAYWDRFKDTVLSEAGEKMNDTYLKANNQTDGTRSYGRMVDLLLAEYKQKNH